jgi:hypothetical protein
MTIMPQDKAGADVAPKIEVKMPQVTVYTDGKNQVLHIPTSHDEMMALTARRDQLNEQLESVTDRRNDLIEQMRTAPNPAMAGLQGQLSVLDARILQLENDLATTGQEIAAASPALISMAEQRPDEDSNGSFDDGVGAGVAGSVVVMPVLFFFLYRRWKKSPRNRGPLMISADSERLQRLEQGMDAVAIEIERISEGQRFVTKLLSETRSAESTPR